MGKKCVYFLGLFFLMINLFHLSAQENVDTKTFSFEFENQTVSSILGEISKQSGLEFSYNSQKIDTDQKITFKAKGQTIDQILTQLCKQLNLEYKILNQQVVLKPAKTTIKKDTKFTISGYVKDQSTGETLPGATIQIENTSTGTISNNYGFYSLTLQEGDYQLLFSFVGYRDTSRNIELTKNQILNLELPFNSELLGEVTITTNEELENIEKSQMSRIKVNPKSLNTLPEFAGEVGLIKSLQTLPGIKTHSDGSAFFFVRGGNKDQNLILIDEAPIYNPAHLFGYYSVIIPDVAKDINIYKADLPMDKGDRLSSVIDVQTKDGNMRKTNINGVLSPFMYRFSLEGPVVKNKLSYYTSFRHSNFEWLYKRAAPNGNLYMYDLNAKLNWKINKNNRLYYSFFYGKDNLINEAANENGGIRWYNFTSTLRWNHIYNSRLFSNLTIYGSQYNYKLLTGANVWESQIGNFSLKYDFTYYLNIDLTFKFGAEQTFQNFNPGNLTDDNQNLIVPGIATSQASKTAFYFSSEQNLGEKFSYKAGIRMPMWFNSGPTTIYQFDTNYNVTDTLHFQDGELTKAFANLDPRVSIKYKLSETSSLKLSFGIYHQYIHMLSNSISPFSSFEIWMPSSTNIKPQRADQVALGYYKFLKKTHLEFIAEAYYKKMYNQIDYTSHANLLLNSLIEGELRFGEAKSYGIEFLLRRTKGRLSGWISYTWSRTLKEIEGVNNNNEFPAYYDRPHDFAVFASYHLSKRVNVSANWIYYTGSAITTPIGFYSYNGYSVPLYGDKNNDRLPDYHRLDVALNWQLNKSDQRYQHNLTFAIYNLYNHQNPVSINFNKIESGDEKFVVPSNLFGNSEIVTTQKHLMGILPSITYKFRI